MLAMDTGTRVETVSTPASVWKYLHKNRQEKKAAITEKKTRRKEEVTKRQVAYISYLSEMSRYNRRAQ